MRKFLSIAALFLSMSSLIPLHAREWRSADGKKKFEATYISNDGTRVTLRRNSRILTVGFDKLHEDDQQWLRDNHPVKDKVDAVDQDGKKVVRVSPKGAAFDTLHFGDTRKEVLKKLNESAIVDGTVAEVMLARVGLNGIYRTKQTIGGLHCHLYFDWDGQNKLKEVTLRTKPQPESSYRGRLKNNWAEMIELLTTLHGAPAQGADYPSTDDLQDGLILGSHLWHTEEGQSVLLGTGQEGVKYSVIVRITSERIETNPVDETGK